MKSDFLIRYFDTFDGVEREVTVEDMTETDA